jgi:cytoskeleton protein RodZ
MSTFGENLRREREMRGVTLEEISENTKINVRLLKALEADRFSELPGGIFTRNFIRAYCQYLGLDEEHALAEYKRAAGAPSDNDLTRLAQNRPLSSPAGARARLLPWVVIAVLLGSGYAVYRYSEQVAEIKPAPRHDAAASLNIPSPPGLSSAASSASSSAQGAGPSSNPASSSPASDSNAGSAPDSNVGANPPGTPPASAVNTDQAATLGEGNLVLRVSTTEDAWMAVAADGKTLWQHHLPANSTRTFRAKDSFDVTTGNAQGTALTLNGEVQKPLGREGEFKRVHLTRDNLQARQ